MISGNGFQGVVFNTVDTADGTGIAVMFFQNTIGLRASQAAALPNALDGINVVNSARVTIGGPGPGAGNTIAGNGFDGIDLDNAQEVSIEGNAIGTTFGGAPGLGNASDGIHIGNSPNVTVGGSEPGAGNVISGNVGRGMRLVGPQSTSIRVAGNRIGTNPGGSAALPNGSDGVLIDGDAHDTIVGGPAAGERNVISGNESNGVHIFGAQTNNNLVAGNFIGTSADGLSSIENGDDGVFIEEGVGNSVGGGGPGAGNLISGNGANGVEYSGDASNASVRGNLIGTDATGNAALSNGLDGLRSAGVGIIIGGAQEGEGNVISGNVENGVQLQGMASANLIRGNRIGVAADGITALANGKDGVFIRQMAAANSIGGTLAGEGNVLSHNLEDGVRMDGNMVLKNAVRGNSIHSNPAKGIELLNAANNELPAPVVTTASAATVSGTSCANCLIDVFSDSNGQGRVYEGTTTASAGGAWTLNAAIVGPKVTATATDADGNTSEFSASVDVQVPVPQLNSVSPTIIVRGVTGVMLTATGSGFIASVTGLSWNGSPRTTTVLGPTTLEATVLAADLQVLGDYAVTIVNPAPGGGISGVVLVRVRSRADANCNLAITVADALHIRLVVAALAQPALDCVPDADGDGDVTAADSLFVLQVLAGLAAVP